MPRRKERPIVLTATDHERLVALAEAARGVPGIAEEAVEALAAELARARVVPADQVPPDVVTMNSIVRLRDLEGDEAEVYELVFPADADVDRNRISILAPIGTAILGYRVGDVIEWKVPAGLRRLRVDEVLYQPERAGLVAG